MLIELLSNYGLFLLKTITIVVSILLIISAIINSKKSNTDVNLTVKNINIELDELEKSIKKNIFNKSEFKKFLKLKKKSQKDIEKKLFVLDFKGNIRASEIVSLRREISGILLSYKKGDEVLLRLENSGGTVHEHGLAASQLKRIKDNKIPLTICVDKVAASGGYMMACVANKILASPFAIIGSIGVLAQVPNFNKLLKDKGIIFLIIPTGLLEKSLKSLSTKTGSFKIFPIWPNQKKASKRLILLAKKGGASPTELMSGIRLLNNQGKVTKKARTYSNNGIFNFL